MYFKRKIDQELNNWLKTIGHSPALVSGVRQCGKTRSIKEFAKKNFKNVIYVNFWEVPAFKDAFNNSLKVDEVISSLTFLDSSIKFIPNETILILDEIQDCPNARLALKTFKEDKRLEVIASGSYIGLNIENKGDKSVPKPNGSEDIIFMKTMDFEEFLWAFGYDSSKLQIFYDCLDEKKKIPDIIHSKMKELFQIYMCIGGYPEVISIFLNNNRNYNLAYKKIVSLIFDIKGDPAKRKNDKGEPLYTPYEIARIQNAFDLISTFTQGDNKRFIVSKISGGNGLQKEDAINYLLNANVAFKVYNVANLSSPLKNGTILRDFKLFYSDIGLLTASYGFDTIRAIINDTIGMNKGHFFESLVADCLYKADIPIYYFRKNTGLEVDFVISYEGYSTLVEVKAKSGNVKSSKTILSHPDHYGKVRLIKFGDYNIGFSNDCITLPYYLIFALFKNYFTL